MSIPEVRIAVAALRVALAKGIVTPDQATQAVLILQKDSQVTWPGGVSPSTQMLMQQTPQIDTRPSTIHQRYYNNVLYGSVDAANAARARDAGGPQDQQALTNTATTTKSERYSISKADWMMSKADSIARRKMARTWIDTEPGRSEPPDNEEVDYYSDLLAKHHPGRWVQADIPVADTEEHYQGHSDSEDFIDRYADKRKAGSEFPRIIAKPHPEKPGKWQTIDGFHRLGAARKLGQETIPAWVPAAKVQKSEDKPANKPFRTSGGPKKFAVYVKDGDSKKKVTFGDPNMEIKRDSPERRKNFRARHNCENPGPKTKARYWSCRMWSKSKVSSVAKRCWDGYEPTPGKKAYSKGSCRPKA